MATPSRCACLLGLLWMAGCGGAGAPGFDPLRDPLPPLLSALGVLSVDAAALTPVNGIAYGLGQPLFSDYAQKYRTLHLPPDGAARWAGGAAETLAMPPGTVLTKTFYYPQASAGTVATTAPVAFAGPDAALERSGLQLLETRVLVARADGSWEAAAYVWDAEAEDARLQRSGALMAMETDTGMHFDYLVPDTNQCAGCHGVDHGSRGIAPIGPKPANLAAVAVPGAEHQLALWQARGQVELPAATPIEPWPPADHAGGTDPAAARAYLDVNCAHCHSDTGAADTAGLDLRFAAASGSLGLCKPPVAAGRGSGGRAYDIWPGAADRSILTYRLAHDDVAVMMPELGRSLVHEAGVALVSAWIDAMPGGCRDARSL